MAHAFILIIVGLTSLGTYIVGIKRLRLSASGLWVALGEAFACVGLTVIFFLLNLAIGMLAILAARFFSGGFVSLYTASDLTMLVLSGLQALAFQAWRANARHRHPTESRSSARCDRAP
jgi:hypothetical protein